MARGMMASLLVRTAKVGAGAQWPDTRLQQSEAGAGRTVPSRVTRLEEVWMHTLACRGL